MYFMIAKIEKSSTTSETLTALLWVDHFGHCPISGVARGSEGSVRSPPEKGKVRRKKLFCVKNFKNLKGGSLLTIRFSQF